MPPAPHRPAQTVVGRLLEQLESDDFYCDVAISSSAQGYLRRVTNHPLTRLLADCVRADSSTILKLVDYLEREVRSIRGNVRSEKDAALCAALVTVSQTAATRTDDLLRYLRTTRELALRWLSDVAELVSVSRVGTSVQTTQLGAPSQMRIYELQAGLTRAPAEVCDAAGVSWH